MKTRKNRSPQNRQAQSHLQKAIDFHLQHQLDAALRHYDKAIALNPNLAKAYANRGALSMQSGQNEPAMADLNRAIELDPDFADAYANRGLLHTQSGENELALADLNRAIELDPDSPETYANRGSLFKQSKANELALEDFNRVIELKPDSPETYVNRGLLFKEFENNELALANFNRAIELKPDYFDAYSHLGILFLSMKQYKSALESFEKALQLNPSSSRVYCNIGVAFQGNEQVDIALEYYEKAIELDPGLASAYCNYGTALLKLNAFEAAIEWFDKAIALDPNDPLAYYSKAFPLLVLGRFEEGLPLYEYRFKTDFFKLEKVNIPGKLWLGEQSIRGKTILLHHDAGYGDSLQFSRYAKLLSALGAKVILQVPPGLANLLKNLEGVDEIVVNNEALTLETRDLFPPFDVYCPVMSLLLAFKTNLETIPAEVPYLYADPEKVAIWKNRLGKKTRPRVGLAWSGNPVHLNDNNRSIMLAQLLPYLPDNCEYISLQKEVRDIDKIIFAAMTEWQHYEEELEDFSDTAALCSLMDVVISVDTSVAHLSGALGKPTWVLLPFSPDWRWLLDRRDSPWYPGMRLYRQNQPGNWGDVFDEVRNDLLELRSH